MAPHLQDLFDNYVTPSGGGRAAQRGRALVDVHPTCASRFRCGGVERCGQPGYGSGRLIAAAYGMDEITPAAIEAAGACRPLRRPGERLLSSGTSHLTMCRSTTSLLMPTDLSSRVLSTICPGSGFAMASRRAGIYEKLESKWTISPVCARA